MAKSTRIVRNPFLTVTSSSPFFDFSPLTSLLFFSPKKRSPRSNYHSNSNNSLCTPAFSLFFLSLLLFSFTLIGISVLNLTQDQQQSSCSSSMISPSASFSSLRSPAVFASLDDNDDNVITLKESVMLPLPVRGQKGNLTAEEKEFWKQPDGEGYRPCLDFGIEYRKRSVKISKEKKRFLVVVVSGGLNQQKNQIVDAVVIARILEAALVVPILQVNRIWGDESEFSDIFDVEHFKRTLQADVRIVSTLPSTHLMSHQSIENQIPHDVSPVWIRARFFKQLSEEGLIVLKGLDSKLSSNLPPDLQKLRCKVAFHALRFATPIQKLGNQLARRMWIEGPYIALHLRLEMDVWIRTGCLTGLGTEYDRIIANVRESHPEYLTGRLNMTYSQRRLAGLCPLSGFEMGRLLKALGAKSSARVYIAGGEPFGGIHALQKLAAEFPNLITKEILAHKGELYPYTNKSSALAAIDYIVSLSSDVFLPSHGGNMGRAMQGHRAYVGHRKFIRPNKREMLPIFENTSISDAEFGRIIRKLHRKSQGQPEVRSNKRYQDVIAFPVPDCMCKRGARLF